MEHLSGITIILLMGMIAQWAAWRFNFPSILLLLLFGFLVGPVFGVVQTDALFGDLLSPLVTVSVAIILFDGGLSLKFKELKETHRVVRNLLSIGILVHWALIAIPAKLFLHLDWPVAILLGAILTVTGPTVVGPLIRQVGLKDPIHSIVKWEGMLIGPIGSLLAVLVFESIMSRPHLVPVAELISNGTLSAAVTIGVGTLEALTIGLLLGVPGALVLIEIFKRRWVPDLMQTMVTLTFIVLFLTVSNMLQEQSGLLTVTVMGVIIANQTAVPTDRIVAFKENLRELLIASLFIILSARLKFEDIQMLDEGFIWFIASLVLVARPASVVVSTWGASLNWKELLFLHAMAPRGIVSAAMSSIVALSLTNAGVAGANLLVPIVFMTILMTITIYGLAARPLAYALKLVPEHPQGILMVGAHWWALDIAKALREAGIQVSMLDNNREHILDARRQGFKAVYGTILSDQVVGDVYLQGIGYVLAMTSNDEVNTLAVMRFSKIFSEDHVYQLFPNKPVRTPTEAVSQNLLGRLFTHRGVNYGMMEVHFMQGARVQTIEVSADISFEVLKTTYVDSIALLFVVTPDEELKIISADEDPGVFTAGEKLILIVDPGVNIELDKLASASKFEIPEETQ
ncbi:MAG: cation:proton antiporter [Vampirovibrio sp.]|nr:cation:proton antiporter [Vampirovibrio sp.]